MAAEHLAMTLTLERVGPHLDLVGDDRLEQRAFDRLTQLARQLLGAPVTMMSLIDPDEHFFKSECDKNDIWATLGSAPLIYSFCRDATRGGPVVLNDCGDDTLSAGHIAQLGVVAYAAVPLRDVQGRYFGSFLAFDTVRRDWSVEDVQTFSEIAELVMTKFQLRRKIAISNAHADALKQSEQRTHTVIETAPDAFISIDADGAVTEWNPAARQMFGWSREEVLGRNVSALIVPPGRREDHERKARRYLPVAASELTRTVIEASAMRRDGSELPIEISVSGLRADDGWSFHAFLHDISDRRRAERLTDEFLALVSHELRTPLSSIVAHVELLQDAEHEDLPEPIRRQFLDVISRNSVRLQRLVGDLLFVAQLDSSHLDLCMGPVDIGEIASEAVQAAEPRAAQQGLEMILEAGDAATVIGDRDRLGQTFDNLITNAINYSPDGGKVVVRVTGKGDQVVVEVRDQGVGIPAEEQEQIFRRFFRASTAVDLHVQGVGLGLLIVKTIVLGHGGQISVSSAPGQGTTFRLLLPVAPGVKPPNANPDAKHRVGRR